MTTQQSDQPGTGTTAELFPGRQYLTFRETGMLLGCTANAIRMKVRRGVLTCAVQNGRRFYIDRFALQRQMQGGAVRLS